MKKVEIMKAFANGASIEVFNGEEWIPDNYPVWDWEYRDYRLANPRDDHYLRHKISVMEAHAAGETIESREYSDPAWEIDENPTWNWLFREYRVRKPRVNWEDIPEGTLVKTSDGPMFFAGIVLPDNRPLFRANAWVADEPISAIPIKFVPGPFVPLYEVTEIPDYLEIELALNNGSHKTGFANDLDYTGAIAYRIIGIKENYGL